MSGRLLIVEEVAEVLGVTASWVYEHSADLGVYRLGSGPKARLRFDPAKVDEGLASCSDGRSPRGPSDAVVKPIRRQRPKQDLGTSVTLLPIRGVAEAA